ncbi:MAG: aspartate aminotransferase family protein [Ruminococcaceae bacterium]|nr:aspartate aminotransferase family protein [Oscillospiraceae bacterium]
MNLSEIQALDEKYYMNTFGKRTPVAFERGEGIHLWATDGKKYTDFFAGIAVNVLGHSHPDIVKAVQDQAGKMLHCSNLYYIESQAELAQIICENSCADKVFFANSGAEANEGAIKLARIYFKKKGQSEKTDFICLNKSFHGRTLTTATATGQPKYNKPFTPLTPGFTHVNINDFEALEAAVTDKTCAIMLEPVQGESGVYPLDPDYAKKVRQLCDEKGILLIFDEVQTGIGRTGCLFGYERLGVEPDIFTLAKALGGGVPIGAVCAKDAIATGFEPGDHGSTFGGNPLACSAGLAVMRRVLIDNIVEKVGEVSTYMMEKLEALKKSTGKISEIRNAGHMYGIVLASETAGVVRGKLFEKGWLVGSVGTNVLRVLPPLIIENKDVDDFMEVLNETLIELV